MQMNIKIVEESVEKLAEYSEIPISFTVERRLDIEPVRQGLGGLVFVERKVARTYVKDYDEGEGPTRWLKLWDISHWGVFSAYEGIQRLGGAVVGWKTPKVDVFEDRDDLAVLWDIRVHPDYRRHGIGSLLFDQAVSWARRRGCRQFKIETQNINVAACAFYAKHGCRLGAVHTHAYSGWPNEAQLLWYKDL